jgi:hypothetical protein
MDFCDGLPSARCGCLAGSDEMLVLARMQVPADGLVAVLSLLRSGACDRGCGFPLTARAAVMPMLLEFGQSAALAAEPALGLGANEQPI